MSENPRFSVLDSRGLLAVGGSERVSFLQGLVSNDMEQVAPDRAVYAALLSPQGKYQYDFFVVEMDGVLLIDCERDALEGLKKRLSLFKLRADVTLEDRSGEFCVAGVFGDGALSALGLDETPGHAVTLGGGVVCTDPRMAAVGGRAYLPLGKAETALNPAGLQPAPATDYDRLRLTLGLPDGSRDLIVDKSILLEAGFDELNGVDWNKGCFMGQELTARTKYRGLIKKRLMPVAFDGTPPEAGTPVMASDREAGEVRSSLAAENGGIGLALMRLDYLEGAETLLADGVGVTATRPDWMVLPER
ncbi:MAG: folate-binding protein YgfZ [Alphaproteobacteria bacterium]|nr:folate-binding protein YgfZ [Alphaproteobacteria bacterium]